MERRRTNLLRARVRARARGSTTSSAATSPPASCAALRDRGIRGLTSNPTIFQKAIQGSSDYDEQFARAGRRRAARSSTTTGRWSSQDIHGACDVFDPVYDVVRRRRRLRQRRGRRPAWPTTSRAPRPPRAICTSGSPAANLMVKIPATAEGVEPIRPMIAEGRNINVTLIFSLDRYAEVIEAYLARARALRRRRRRRPVQGGERRQLLRQPRRHRDRPPARRDRVRRGARAARQGRRRPGQARLPAVRRDVLRATLGRARRPRRPGAAPAVGQHVDEEPRLPRHALRRRADRAATRSTRCPTRRSRRSPTTARSPAVSTRTSTRPRPCGRARRGRRRHDRRRRRARARRGQQLPEELRRADHRRWRPRPPSCPSLLGLTSSLLVTIGVGRASAALPRMVAGASLGGVRLNQGAVTCRRMRW